MGDRKKRYIDELLELVAHNVTNNKPSANRAKDYLVGSYKVFLQQLQINGKIMIPHFGTFELKQKKERIMKNGSVNSNKEYCYVEPKYYVVFTMSKRLDYFINKNNFVYAGVESKTKQKKNLKEYNKENPDVLPSKYVLTKIINNAVNRQKRIERRHNQNNDETKI